MFQSPCTTSKHNPKRRKQCQTPIFEKQFKTLPRRSKSIETPLEPCASVLSADRLGVAEGPWIAYIQGSSQFRFLVLEFSSSLSASLISVFQCNVNLSVRQRLSSIGRMMPLLGLCRLVTEDKLRKAFRSTFPSGVSAPTPTSAL